MGEDRFDEDIVGEETGMEDFPKEIVQLLMKNHPIKNPSAAEEGSHRERTVHEETNDFKMPSRKHKKIKNEETKNEHLQKNDFSENNIHNNGQENQQEEYIEEIKEDEGEEIVQLVRRTSRSGRKSPLYYEDNETNNEEFSVKKKTKKKQKKAPQTTYNEGAFCDIETKEETGKVLDDFFRDNEEYDDEESTINGKTIIITAVAVAALIVLFLGYKTISLTGRLNEANKKVEAYHELKEKHEELKLSMLALEEQLYSMEDEDNLPVDNVGDVSENHEETNTVPQEEPALTEPANIDPTQFDTYTVVDGDSFWIIAKKTLGNGALYQKILDANGLSENDRIKEGQTLKIPKQ